MLMEHDPCVKAQLHQLICSGIQEDRTIAAVYMGNACGFTWLDRGILGHCHRPS
jgi:hypothetical protein